LEKLYLFTSKFIKWDCISDKIARIRCKITRVIDQHAAMTQVTNIAIIGLFVQTDKYISIIAHGLNRLIANTYLEHTRSTQNFGWECAESIHVIHPACGAQGDNVTT